MDTPKISSVLKPDSVKSVSKVPSIMANKTQSSFGDWFNKAESKISSAATEVAADVASEASNITSEVVSEIVAPVAPTPVVANCDFFFLCSQRENP